MNLIDVTKEFATEEQCFEYLEKMRWPNGVRCTVCGNDKLTRYMKKGKTGKCRPTFQCLEPTCKNQFTATSGTIFQDSHLPLTKWFLAIALVVDAKKGISANQIRAHLGVQYKTAWHLMHRIRESMQQDTKEQLKGTVEVDETYIGGRYDRRRKRGRYEKQAVMGLIERSGRVEARPIPTASKSVLVGIIKERVAPGSNVFTDELGAYKSVAKTHRHETVNHIALEYARGNVHTNTIENFWSLFKRGLIGSFHKVSVKHLPRYLNEFTYRFNNRKDADLFSMTLLNLLSGIALQYKDLTKPEARQICH